MIVRFENFNDKKACVNLLHADAAVNIARCRYERPSEDEFFMPFAAVTCVSQGKKVIFLNGDKHEMKAGDALFIPKNTILYSDILVKKEPFIAVNMIIKNDQPEGEGALLESMAGRVTEPVQLGELAASHHMSLSTFKRCFLRHAGVSPGQWLIQKRLEKARFLLLHKHLSVTNACFESGFHDLSYFIRRYKQQFGVTPGHRA